MLLPVDLLVWVVLALLYFPWLVLLCRGMPSIFCGCCVLPGIVVFVLSWAPYFSRIGIRYAHNIQLFVSDFLMLKLGHHWPLRSLVYECRDRVVGCCRVFPRCCVVRPCSSCAVWVRLVFGLLWFSWFLCGFGVSLSHLCWIGFVRLCRLETWGVC